MLRRDTKESRKEKESLLVSPNDVAQDLLNNENMPLTYDIRVEDMSKYMKPKDVNKYKR